LKLILVLKNIFFFYKKIKKNKAANGINLYDNAFSICTLTNSNSTLLFTAPSIEGDSYVMYLDLYSNNNLVESWFLIIINYFFLFKILKGLLILRP